VIFGNIEELWKENASLLTALQEVAMTAEQKLGTLFLNSVFYHCIFYCLGSFFANIRYLLYQLR
jgi:hypothetical protein